MFYLTRGNATYFWEIRTHSEGRFTVSAAGKRGGPTFLIALPPRLGQGENTWQGSRTRYARLARKARHSESGLARLTRPARRASERLADVFSILLEEGS